MVKSKQPGSLSNAINMWGQRILLLATIVAGVIMFVACTKAQTIPRQSLPTMAPSARPETSITQMASGALLLEQRCTACHGLARVESARKDRSDWERTVVRMVNKGAQLSKEEQEILIIYLTESYGR